MGLGVISYEPCLGLRLAPAPPPVCVFIVAHCQCGHARYSMDASAIRIVNPP